MSDAIAEGEELDPVYEWTAAYIWIIYSIILFALNVCHGYFTYLDLYTIERASIKHRRTLPKKTKFYKLIAICTCLSSISYLLAAAMQSIILNFSAGEHCNGLAIPILMAVNTGKSLMYSIFLFRLHVVYGESAYGYNKISLRIIFIIICIVTLFIYIVQITGIKDFEFFYSLETYPFFCNFAAPIYVLGTFCFLYRQCAFLSKI